MIARNGKPVAQLGPVPARSPRTPGRMRGRIDVGDDFDDWLDEDEVLHRDPFDRMLVAQAQAEGAALVSADDQIRQYDVSVLP